MTSAKLDPRRLKEIKLNKPELIALHSRLGESKIKAVLRDFYARLSSDVLVGFFFAGRDTNAIADRQLEFLLRAMGATPSYSGKSPAQAHDELPPILRGHFDRRLRVLEETLRHHQLNEKEIEAWLSFENTFRDAIVQE